MRVCVGVCALCVCVHACTRVCVNVNMRCRHDCCSFHILELKRAHIGHVTRFRDQTSSGVLPKGVRVQRHHILACSVDVFSTHCRASSSEQMGTYRVGGRLDG